VDATLAHKTFHHIDMAELHNPAEMHTLMREDSASFRIKCQVSFDTPRVFKNRELNSIEMQTGVFISEEIRSIYLIGRCAQGFDSACLPCFSFRSVDGSIAARTLSDRVLFVFTAPAGSSTAWTALHLICLGRTENSMPFRSADSPFATVL
jgi:hypothetical protein